MGASLASYSLPSYARSAAPRNLILVYAKGGWDPTWVFDPKPDSAYVDTGAGDYSLFGDGAIWTDGSRPSVTTFFERYGSLAAVINGINVPSVSHQSCRTRMFTGSRDVSHPDLEAIVGHELGPNIPIPYLVIGELGYAGSFGADVGTTECWPLARAGDPRWFWDESRPLLHSSSAALQMCSRPPPPLPRLPAGRPGVSC